MKHNNLLLSFFFVGFVIPCFSQVTMPEIIVAATRYKYLSAVDNKELAQPVKMLERTAATFDVKNSEFYEDEYDEYYISFYIPQGNILATYNNDGKLLRTAERYKNIALPKAVSAAFIKKYPDWGIPKNVYLVTYEEEKGASKVWKVLMNKGDKRMRVKVNEKGDFITKL